MHHPTLDPVRLGDFAWAQLLDGGRIIIAPDPLPEDAPADIAAHYRHYMAQLDLMGFEVVGVGWAGLCAAISEAER